MASPDNTADHVSDRACGRVPTSGPRTFLVGLAADLDPLTAALANLQPAPVVVGRWDPAQQGQGDWGQALVNGLASDPFGFAATLTQQQVQQVIFVLPQAYTDAAEPLTAVCESLSVTVKLLPTLADQLAGLVAWSPRVQSSAADSAAPTPPTSTPPPSPAPSMISTAPAAPVKLMTIPRADTLDAATLLGRTPCPLDEERIGATLAGRTVLITGAGGSIGSELSRLVARFAPAKLILVERSENALFEIDRQIARLFPDLARAAVLHDITHAARTLKLLEQHRPHVIFHAAAHKHVPMMEDHPAEAVENNFFGTRCIADAADAVGVQRFVMISSDKAVNPSSVMGATKRLAELYIRFLNARSRTTFCMVRFGNVLGSACSVLPIWTRQIAEGGPVTVTHPDMTRYFMTIPEAAGLVLQSASLSGTPDASQEGGEVFLLDMGRPIRILDLAHRFVKSQGLTPGSDIEIAITGIRPGEKLFEELAYDGEDMVPTPHPAVRIWKTAPPDAAAMRQIIDTFDRLRHKRDPQAPTAAEHPWQHASRESILNALRASVPEMLHAAAG
jgi:FlaA1/EpsC-like NDP-sugar epimerase